MLFVCAVALLAPRAPVRADSAAGLVTACTAANLAAAVAQADYVSFACGPAPVTITTGELTIPAGRSITIDGGDLVTLSGGEANRLFNVAAGAELTLQHLTLLAGVAPHGGAILNAGTLTLVETRLRDNRANDPEGSGGAISNQAGTVQIVAGTFLNNRANGRGGAIANHDGALSVADSLFERNQAVDGGAINSTGMLTITNGAMLENLADGGAGGAISLYAGEAVISGASIEANMALFGGGLFLSGEREARAVLRDSLVRDHVLAERFPGALGGGIYATGDLTLERVAIDDNSANNGGGLLISGPNGRLSARDATISNNNATGVGGGLLLGAGGGHELTNVTISGNSAGSFGGGVYGQNTPATLRHVSLVNNRAATGANLYAQRTSLTLQATILAAPQLGANCAGDGTQPTIASLGANMADDGSCAFAAAGDRNFADLIAGALDDNGGQTLTHLPGSASPAVDAAPIAGCPERDQRGFMRPAGAQCDSGATEVEATPPPNAPPFTPLQRPGGQRGTISLAPNQGAAGQTIQVSGQAPNRATGILIATVVNGQTIVGAEAPVSTAGAYTLSLTVPPGLAAGPTRICAIPRGVANAELACAAFTVAPMPPGWISGGSSRLSGGQAVLQLFDPNQRLAYTTPIDANGNFQLPNVTPGVYAYAVSGRTNAPVGGGIVALRPGTQIDLSRELSANITTCLVHSSARVTGALGIRPPPDPNAPSPYAGFTIVGQAFNPNRDMIDQLNLELRAEVERNAFGTYIQGVPTWVTFTAYPQTREPVQYVLYRFYDPNDKLITMRLRPAPFELEYDVAALPARHSPGRTAYMTVTPVVAGKEVPCAPRYDIDVVPNPLAKRGVQPAPYSAIAMDYANEQYRFTIAMPHVPGLLPWSYSFPRLPLVGVLNNRLNTGIQAEGTFKLNGATTISAFRAINDIYILNNQVLGPYSRQPLQILPNSTNGTCPSGARTFGLNDWNRQVYYVRYANPNLEVGIEPVDVPILPLFGVAEVAVRAGGSNAAGVLIAACIAPLRPEASLVLEPYLQKKRVQGLNVKLLAGVAHVGADLYSDEKLLLPIRARLVGGLPGVDNVDVCIQLIYTLKAWAVLPVLGYREKPFDLLDYTSCLSNPQFPLLATDDPPPEPFVSPDIAVAPDGRALSAYVEPSRPGDERTQVLVRFRQPNSAAWSAPVGLSNPQSGANAPVVAFVGPDATPLAAWVENPLTPAEAAALEGDLGALLNRQEIVYSLFVNGAWSAPLRLTDDQFADGLPTLAGGPGGAVLAWTRDLDGDAQTRGDQRIAVTEFDLSLQRFGPLSLLSGGAGGLNGDVQAAYDPAGATPTLVWIHDADSDLRSAADRRIAVATLRNGAWATVNPQPLPPRVDSPAISVGPDGVRLAFLVREDSAGETPLLGANGALWTARLANDTWSAAPLRDEQGAPIYAETPQLAHNSGETLLLARRFGTESVNAEQGQLTLSQARSGGAFGAPLALTDTPQANWQAALAINPLNQQALILNVTRNLGGGAQVQAAPALLGAPAGVLNSAASPLSAIDLAVTADPALDALTATPQLPRSGTLVQVRATVRNSGRNPAEQLVVTLYRGTPGSGAVVAVRPLDTALAFGETREVAFTVEADGGELPLYAEVTTTGADATTANNRAGLVLGRPTPPAIANVARADDDAAMTISWAPAPNEQPLGYQVLRSATPEGALELIGQSATPTFSDLLAAPGRTYCYAIQAYTTNSLSAPSAVVCGGPAPTRIYLPLVRR
jgi:predicted outer membrane repeat protein